MAYCGGDELGAIVAEVGHHSTKMGFAGEDCPRALFRSDVAVLRSSCESGKASDNTSSSSSSDNNSATKQTPKIEAVQYDLSRPLNPIPTPNECGNNSLNSNEIDGKWETANPIDPITGLLNPSSNDNDESSSLDLFNRYLEHGISSSLRCGTVNNANDQGNITLDHPMLLIEKSYNPPNIRQEMTELLFEQYDVPALFLGRDAVMSCYAVGRTTGVVVDVGGLGTTVSPVHEGWVEGKGVLRGVVGGDVMDGLLLDSLDKLVHEKHTNSGNGGGDNHSAMPGYQVRMKNHTRRKSCFHKLARLEMSRYCKESVAAVAEIGYEPGDKRYATMPKTPYELPDGTKVDISAQDKYELGEMLMGMDDISTKRREELCARRLKALFSSNTNTLLAGEVSSSTVQHMVCDSAFKCDRDQQAQLLGNVILSGGGACLDGMVERLRDEVEAIIHTHTPGWRVKVLAPAPAERMVCSWLGGSILASLGSFHEMWMTKAEYQEHGAVIVNRKCP